MWGKTMDLETEVRGYLPTTSWVPGSPTSKSQCVGNLGMLASLGHFASTPKARPCPGRFPLSDSTSTAMDSQLHKTASAVNIGCLGFAGCITIWPIVWFSKGGINILLALEIVSLLCILCAAFEVAALKSRTGALVFAVLSFLINCGIVIYGFVVIGEYSGKTRPFPQYPTPVDA